MEWLRLLVGILLASQVHTSVSLVRLVSWNLLAQEYALPVKFPSCDPQYLEWEHRKGLILGQLFSMDADLICLQEVQIDLWSDLQEHLSEEYHYVLQNVTRGHNVAIALLIRKTCNLTLERAESRSRALLTTLRDTDSKSRVYVCAIHLEAGGTDQCRAQRYYQLKSLFKRLRNQCTLDQVALEDAALVFAGDFNMLRTHPLYNQLTTGRLDHPEFEQNNKPAIQTVPLRDAYFQTETEDKATLRESTVCDDGSKHDMSDKKCEKKYLVRTCSYGWVLDYVFVSRVVCVTETLLFHQTEATTTDPQYWPSQTIPSDHIPIGVVLDI